MFDEYLKRISKLEYIGTIKNGSVLEAGIIVDLNNVDTEQREKHFAHIEEFNKKFPNPLSLQEYKQHRQSKTTK